MNKSRYQFHTVPLPVALLLVAVIAYLWHGWRESDTAHRQTLDDIKREYVTR